MPFAATWMDLEVIILIEVCQKPGRQLPDITYMWNPKYVTSGSTYKPETDPQMIEKQLVIAKVGEGWTGSLGAQNPQRSSCTAAVWSLSHAQLSAAPWTVARQALLSMALLRQEYWSGVPFASPGDLLINPGIEPRSLAWQVDSPKVPN